MAKVYYPKTATAKLLDGVQAGLAGGVVFLLVMILTDVLTPARSWWNSVSTVGSTITGVQNFNTASPDFGSFLLGVLLSLVAFVLFGMGLPSYMRLFRMLNIPPAVGGALYGLLLWLLVHLLVINGLTGGRINLWWALLAYLAAGAAMGQYLSMRKA